MTLPPTGSVSSDRIASVRAATSAAARCDSAGRGAGYEGKRFDVSSSAADEPGDRVGGFLQRGLLLGSAGSCSVQDAVAQVALQ